MSRLRTPLLLEGLKDGPREGISSMYNIRAEPDRGFGKAAIQKLPYACNSCMDQLKSHGYLKSQQQNMIATWLTKIANIGVYLKGQFNGKSLVVRRSKILLCMSVKT